MASLIKLARLTPKLCLTMKRAPIMQYVKVAAISTSKKSKDTVTIGEIVEQNTKVEEKLPKNWISYGFSDTDIVDDSTQMHLIFFATITMCFVGVFFILMYQPDNRMIDWHKREAFLELRHREKLGLPLIDMDVVPHENMVLPSDEDLGEVRIII